LFPKIGLHLWDLNFVGQIFDKTSFLLDEYFILTSLVCVTEIFLLADMYFNFYIESYLGEDLVLNSARNY
jgi:hypothetical protein